MIPVKRVAVCTQPSRSALRWASTVTLVMGAAFVHAQVPPIPPPPPDVPFERNVDIMIQKGAEVGPLINFMAAPVAFDVETVTGAPYSGQAVTEFTQTLADGNRIVRQSTAEISRDSLGRTRREEGISMLGPVVNTPEIRRVQITDPTTHTMILLDMHNRIAEKLPSPQIRLMNTMNKIEKAGVGAGDFEVAVPGVPAPPLPPAPPPGGAGVRMIYRSSVAKPLAAPNVEKLGIQIIEGIQAEGTRTTTTIPAGDIGNERPITIVSERWYSPELKVLVMSRQSDPRFGDTTYRLTNITRVEPPPYLFEIPADFTVAEPDTRREIAIRKGIRN